MPNRLATNLASGTTFFLATHLTRPLRITLIISMPSRVRQAMSLANPEFSRRMTRTLRGASRALLKNLNLGKEHNNYAKKSN